MQRLLLSVREAAAQLGGISVRHLARLTAPKGPLPCVRLGKRVFYRLEDLEKFTRQAAEQAAQNQAAEGGHDR